MESEAEYVHLYTGDMKALGVRWLNHFMPTPIQVSRTSLHGEGRACNHIHDIPAVDRTGRARVLNNILPRSLNILPRSLNS
jgi:hypothetical protein